MKKRFYGLFFSFVMGLSLVFMPNALSYTLEDATSLYNMGIDYYSQNQVQKSMDYFKQAISIDPKFYEAYYNLAQIQASYGYIEPAIKSYEKVVQLRPDDYESIYELGRLLFKRGYLNRALSYLDKIPANSDVHPQALSLEQKIKKRQSEIAQVQKQKEEQRLAGEKLTQQRLQPTVKSQVNTQKEENIKPASIEATGSSGMLVQLNAPSGVAADSEGNIYAASFSENKIYKITLDGTKSVYVESVHLGGPIGLAFDEFDNLYVANYIKNNILKVTPSGVISEFAQLRKPYCLSIDYTRNLLVVSEQDTNKVLKFKL